jgi:hypothetical protein
MTVPVGLDFHGSFCSVVQAGDQAGDLPCPTLLTDRDLVPVGGARAAEKGPVRDLPCLRYLD